MASGVPEAAICVQDLDVQCVLQFTLINAAGCALHRRTNPVIHRQECLSVCRTKTTKRSDARPSRIHRNVPVRVTNRNGNRKTTPGRPPVAQPIDTGSRTRASPILGGRDELERLFEPRSGRRRTTPAGTRGAADARRPPVLSPSAIGARDRRRPAATGGDDGGREKDRPTEQPPQRWTGKVPGRQHR